MREAEGQVVGRVLGADGGLSEGVQLAAWWDDPELSPETERRVLRRFEEAQFAERVTMRYPDDVEVTKPKEGPPPFPDP